MNNRNIELLSQESFESSNNLFHQVLNRNGIDTSAVNEKNGSKKYDLYVGMHQIATYSVDSLEKLTWLKQVALIGFPKPKINKNAFMEGSSLDARLQVLVKSEEYKRSSRLFYSCTLEDLHIFDKSNENNVVCFNPIKTSLLNIKRSGENSPSKLSNWITTQYLLTALSLKELNPELTVFINMCGSCQEDLSGMNNFSSNVFNPGHFVFSRYSSQANEFIPYESYYIEQIDKNFGALNPTYKNAMEEIHNQGRLGHFKLLPNISIDEHLGPLYEVIV